MGTSKGYIAPSSPNWASAKRGISSYLSQPSELNKKEAIAKYSKAMNSDGAMYERAASVFSSFTSFASTVKSSGITKALNDFGKNDYNDLSPEEAFSELVNSFSDGSSIDDVIANSCISDALSILEITSFDDLSKVDFSELIKELVCQFAKQKFAQMFDKQIKNKSESVIVANSRLKELQEYIYFTAKYQLTPEVLADINPKNLANEKVVKDVLKNAFDLLEHYYDE